MKTGKARETRKGGDRLWLWDFICHGKDFGFLIQLDFTFNSITLILWRPERNREALWKAL